MPENRVSSLLAWAQAEGKATGIVTTDRLKRKCRLNYNRLNLDLNLIDSLTGASPAGTYAHSADRDWENDEVVFLPVFLPVFCLFFLPVFAYFLAYFFGMFFLMIDRYWENDEAVFLCEFCPDFLALFLYFFFGLFFLTTDRDWENDEVDFLCVFP